MRVKLIVVGEKVFEVVWGSGGEESRFRIPPE